MWEGIITQKGEYNLIFPHLFKECPYTENKIFTLDRNTYQKKFVSINVFPYSILTLKTALIKTLQIYMHCISPSENYEMERPVTLCMMTPSNPCGYVWIFTISVDVRGFFLQP